MSLLAPAGGLPDLWQAVYETPFATGIRESEIVFPALETVHVLALGVMAGSIALVDLRILGVALTSAPAGAVERRLTPTTWIGFVIMAVTGGLLLASEAAKLEHNPAFLLKLSLIGVAGLNMLAFQTFARPAVAALGVGATAPVSARMSAAASLALWAAIIAAGRAVAYFHG